MARSISAACLLLALAGTGCNRAVEPWVGEYHGRHPHSVPEGGDPVIAAQLATVELEIDIHGDFTLEEGGVMQSGTGTFRSDSAALTIDSRLGKPLPTHQIDERRLELLPNGDVRLLDPAAGDPIVLGRLDREPEPPPND